MTLAEREQVLDLLRWIESEHRDAMAAAVRALDAKRDALDQFAYHPATLDELRAQFLLGVAVAEAAARLETWNEYRAKIRTELAAFLS